MRNIFGNHLILAHIPNVNKKNIDVDWLLDQDITFHTSHDSEHFST